MMTIISDRKDYNFFYLINRKVLGVIAHLVLLFSIVAHT